jgi:hypothetical protein
MNIYFHHVHEHAHKYVCKQEHERMYCTCSKIRVQYILKYLLMCHSRKAEEFEIAYGENRGTLRISVFRNTVDFRGI